MTVRVAIQGTVGRHAFDEERARIVDGVETCGPAGALGIVAELAVVEAVREISGVAADDRRIANVGVDAKQAAEPLRPRRSGLTVTVGLTRLIVELTPDVDRRG